MVYYEGTTLWWMFVLNYNTNLGKILTALKKEKQFLKLNTCIPENIIWRNHNLFFSWFLGWVLWQRANVLFPIKSLCIWTDNWIIQWVMHYHCPLPWDDLNLFSPNLFFFWFCTYSLVICLPVLFYNFTVIISEN